MVDAINYQTGLNLTELTRQERRGLLEQKVRQNMARSLARLHPTVTAQEFERAALFCRQRGISDAEMRQHLINLALIRESGSQPFLNVNLTLEQASSHAGTIIAVRRNPSFHIGKHTTLRYYYPSSEGPPIVEVHTACFHQRPGDRPICLCYGENELTRRFEGFNRYTQ